MLIDLHTHSTASDGSLSPSQLVHRCTQAQVKILALTDHDTTAGLEEARKAAAAQDLQIVSGVEISAKYRGGTLHILGLGISEKDPDFQRKLKLYQKARENRNQKVFEKLQAIGLDIHFEELLEFSDSPKGIGRPHIANLLLKKGYVKSFEEAFRSYLGLGTPGFVTKEIFTPEEAIGFIKAAGGMAIVAHPSSLRLDQFRLREYLKMLQRFGLDGIEVFNSSHDPRQVLVYQKIVKELGLITSGGSDFHGAPKPKVELAHWDQDEPILDKMVSPALIEHIPTQVT
ncbi:MAG: PHP domain-containing protein [SAR324 cluster bacterium]|nr:PHP domain-containing protein [SAR324 cluster bacterium]